MLDILPLNKQLEFNKLISVFKTRINLAPDYVTNLLTKSNLSNFNNCMLPTTRINLFKMSFAFSGAHVPRGGERARGRVLPHPGSQEEGKKGRE